MAVIRKEDKKAPVLPKEIDVLLNDSAEAKFLADSLEEKSKALKAEAYDAIKASKTVTMVVSEGIKMPNYTFTLCERENFEVDEAAIKEAFLKKKITLDHLFSMFKGYDSEAVTLILPDAIKKTDPTNYTMLRPKASFKEELAEKYEKMLGASLTDVFVNLSRILNWKKKAA